jgi:hypothetical protein
MAQEYADGAVRPFGLHWSTRLESLRLDVRAWDDGAENSQAELTALGQSVDELGEVSGEKRHKITWAAPNGCCTRRGGGHLVS